MAQAMEWMLARSASTPSATGVGAGATPAANVLRQKDTAKEVKEVMVVRGVKENGGAIKEGNIIKRLQRHMQNDLGRDKMERGIKGSVGSAGRLGINRLNAVEGKELEEWMRR